MKQRTEFCENNQIYNITTLSLKERLRLLFKGTLEAHIDLNVQSSNRVVNCYYQPKIRKVDYGVKL